MPKKATDQFDEDLPPLSEEDIARIQKKGMTVEDSREAMARASGRSFNLPNADALLK